MIREAYSFNQPLISRAVEASCGKLPESYSLVSCDQQNIILDTVKKAERDDGMILRLYDSFNLRTNATIRVAPGFTKAYLCDMMERELEEIPFDGEGFTVPVKNFEILTIKLR